MDTQVPARETDQSHIDQPWDAREGLRRSLAEARPAGTSPAPRPRTVEQRIARLGDKSSERTGR